MDASTSGKGEKRQSLKAPNCVWIASRTRLMGQRIWRPLYLKQTLKAPMILKRHDARITSSWNEFVQIFGCYSLQDRLGTIQSCRSGRATKIAQTTTLTDRLSAECVAQVFGLTASDFVASVQQINGRVDLPRRCSLRDLPFVVVLHSLPSPIPPNPEHSFPAEF